MLRPGLNILWARPRDRSLPLQLHAPGVSGHGTGKTTFCRFLRHLLGEPTFGSDEQRSRLRHAFPDAWVVGEVRLDGESWLVCRPFKVGAHAVAYRGRGIDTLFNGDEGRTAFGDYEQALNRVLVEPLPVATFATSPTPIAWTHLLQWLTRDQECRFTALADLRHTSSESHAPEMAVEDCHFLFRATLELIDTAEQSELEKNKELVKQRQRAEKTAPLLRFRGESAFTRLRAQLPDYRTDLTGTEFLDAVEMEWTRQADGFEAEMKQLVEPASLKAARDKLVKAQLGAEGARQQVGEVRDSIEWIKQQELNLRGETSDTELDAWFRRKFPPERFCGQPLSAAIEWDCPLARGRKLPAENPTTLTTKPTLEQLAARRRTETARQANAEAILVSRESAMATEQQNLQNELSAYDRLRGALSEQIAAQRAIATEAQRAFTDQREAETLEGSLTDLDKRIRYSQELQSIIREQRNAALTSFSETFNRVTRAVLGDDVEGSIRFNGRKVRPTLVHDIDLTSAALETLKIICFDLAAMINGVEGRGHHPRFLIHDGPREADMDAVLYQRLFLLMHELEASFTKNGPSFQYIVTTTEPPPALVQCAPWLISPVLDASKSDGKFLRQDY